MTYVRKHGKPSLFITMSANPNWEEIINQLPTGYSSIDRPDIVSRVFKEKLK